jgi:hypothetical protein
MSKMQTEKTIRNIQKNNLANKNIMEYLPSEIEGFFNPSEPVGNTIISGGRSANRVGATVAACICASINRIPVVILHEADTLLEAKIRSAYQATNNMEIINRGNPVYDPFIGLSNMEISHMVINSAQKGYEIKPNGRQYMDGILGFIRSKGIPTACDMLLRCPHANLLDKLDEANQKGKIGAAEAQNIRNLLMQGQSERAGVEGFFMQLGYQGQSLLSDKATRQRSVSIRGMVDRNALVMLDIQSSTSKVLLNVILNEVQGCLANGKSLMLVVDAISAESNELLEQLLKSNSSRCTTVLSSDDAYAMLGSSDNLFSTLVGTAQKCIVFSHRTGISCGKWAEVFGYCDVDKISHSLGSNQGSYSYGPSTSINVSKDREYRVKPQAIGNMAAGEVYVLSCSTGELAHTSVI